MIFGANFNSVAITGQATVVSSWQAQHVPGVYSVSIEAAGGGGGGSIPTGGKTGEAGGSGQLISGSYFLYSPSYFQGSNGIGGAAGPDFGAGQPGTSGGNSSISSGGVAMAIVNGGAGGRETGTGVGYPSYNPIPSGNGGYGGGGWSSAGVTQRGGQSGRLGSFSMVRIA